MFGSNSIKCMRPGWGPLPSDVPGHRMHEPFCLKVSGNTTLLHPVRLHPVKASVRPSPRSGRRFQEAIAQLLAGV